MSQVGVVFSEFSLWSLTPGGKAGPPVQVHWRPVGWEESDQTPLCVLMNWGFLIFKWVQGSNPLWRASLFQCYPSVISDTLWWSMSANLLHWHIWKCICLCLHLDCKLMWTFPTWSSPCSPVQISASKAPRTSLLNECINVESVPLCSVSSSLVSSLQIT